LKRPEFLLLVVAQSCLSLVSLSAIASAQDFSLPARQADFKTFVTDFENSYAYLDRTEKPWLTWESRYAGAVQQADSKEAFDAVLASALSELHDFHAEVRSRLVNRWLPVPTFADVWAEFEPSGSVITAVRRGSDAEHAGIHVGDLITNVGSYPLEKAVEARLTPAVPQEDRQAREWALLSVLTGKSDEPRVLGLVTPSGRSYTVTLPVERHFDRAPGELAMERLSGNIAVIRFNNSLGEQKTVAAFDKALLEAKDTKGLILDLRDVPSGGDSSVALGIMGRFVSKIFPYQRHRIPNYGQSDVERNWVEFVAPRGPFTYTAPVVVLVNHWTGSMGEGMAVGFDAMQRAVVVGTRMAHLAGAVSDDKLPKTGVDIAYATEQIYHVDGVPRQNWLPPVLVKEPLEGQAEDVILMRGIAELKAHTPWPKRSLGDLHPPQ
jgi:C-terminal processing protease CtpA/Prc